MKSYTVRIDKKLFEEIKKIETRIKLKNENFRFIDATRLAGIKLGDLNGKKLKFIEDIEF